MTQQTFKIFIFVRQPERYIDNRITISRDSKEIGLTQKLIVPFVSSIHFSDEESRRKKKQTREKTRKMKNSFSLTFSPKLSSLLPIYLPGRQFCRKQAKNICLCFIQ